MGSAIHPIGAFVQGPNPIQDIIDGMITGVKLHALMQQTQDEHEATQRVALQQARQNRIQDITQKMLLQGVSRPVNPDGTVTEQGNPLNVDVGGVESSTPISIRRKADKSRLVTYKDQDGNVMNRELLSEPEQIEKQAREKQALARAGQVDVSSIIQGMLPNGAGVDTPYGEAPNLAPAVNPFPEGLYVNPQQVPGIMGDLVRGQDNQRTNQTRVTTNARTNDTRESIATQNNDTKKKIASDRNAAQKEIAEGKTSLRNIGGNVVRVYSDNSTEVIGPAGTPKSAKTDAADAKAREADQKLVDKMQQQEQALHGLRSTLGEALSAKIGDVVPDPLYEGKGKRPTVPANAIYQSLWRNKLDEATKKVAGLQQSQTRLINKWGGDAGSAAGGNALGASSATPQTAVLPPAAVSRLRKGVITTFGNGQSWTIGPDGKPQQVQAQGK